VGLGDTDVSLAQPLGVDLRQALGDDRRDGDPDPLVRSRGVGERVVEVEQGSSQR
jgi:hypothetical protein